MPPADTQAPQDQEAINALFNDLLDKNLDDVADLPEYFDFLPTGFYKLKVVKVEKKTVEMTDKDTKVKSQAPVIQVVYEIMETLELADPETYKPVKAGGRFNESFFFNRDKDKTLEYIKAKYKEIAVAWNVSNILALMDQLEGAEIGATVKSKKDKNDDTKFYISVSNARLA